MYGGACVRGLCRGDLGMLKKNKTQLSHSLFVSGGLTILRADLCKEGGRSVPRARANLTLSESCRAASRGFDRPEQICGGGTYIGGQARIVMI